jgi:signal transduction histidine kinase
MDKARSLFKILVVDDNARNIQVIGTILRKANYEIGFALDGRQAYELLQKSLDYDLVLMDIRMPVMDGFEACRMIKKDERFNELPVIFLSASHETESIIEAFDLGGVDYVTKPFNAKELLSRVNTHIQLKQRSLEVKNYARELEKLNATKDKFFSIIAHDLRNPFEGILMLCKGLLAKGPSISAEEIRMQLSLIVSEADSGNKLLENLLVWSRSQTGSIVFNPAQVNLSNVIQKCTEMINSQAKAKNIAIKHFSPEEISVVTDEPMFCHILRNLLTNAVKFTESPGTITVNTKRTSGFVEISVTDTGIGISEDDLSRLFRIDGNISSRRGTKNEAGSGLGLILCGEFADKLGGNIKVESVLGKGSCFTITLPHN